MVRSLTGKAKSIAFFLAATLPYAYLAASPAQKTQTLSFGEDVAPVFKAHCLSCHSGASASGGLDLSTPSGILKGGSNGKLNKAIAGHPLLMVRIDGSRPPQMPMGMAPLSATEQRVIRDWLNQGMPLDTRSAPKHWAYVAPVLPSIPKLTSPWIRNPIDSFVLEKLKANGLNPSPEAKIEILLRRVTLDLTGLLPKPEDVKKVSGDRSPNAYEKVVDHLLASTHYGERQAREWLDLARYADSDGYEKDLSRDCWLYRDWVINAFNRNEHYDQFTIDQIAGDLLPNATDEQKIATGFQRNTMFNREGGVDQEEAHFLVELDRAEVTSTVWLGSTLNCARCHDHKYDPFTQKDYYKMVAFYNNTAVFPKGPKNIGEEKWFEAELKVPTDEQSAEISKLKTQILALKSQIQAKSSEVDFKNWLAAEGRKVEWSPTIPTQVLSTSGETVSIASDGIVKVTGPTPAKEKFAITLPPTTTAVNALKLEALSDDSLPGKGPGRADMNGNFVLTHLELFLDGHAVQAKFAKADYTQPEFTPLNSLIGDPNGWAVDGGEGKNHSMIIDLGQSLAAGKTLKVVLSCESPYAKHILGKFRIWTSDHPDATSELIPRNLRLPNRTAELKAYWTDNNPDSGPLRIALSRTETELGKIQGEEPSALVMQEKPSTRPLAEWVRHRGEFGSKTELVEAGTPTILNPLPAGKQDRLALARWLVSRQNPLTARVQVNRMWELLFGRGLVETSEDFGTRGSPPTNQTLLDFLACWFMNHQWDMKALYRLIVTSSTYRQSSHANPSLIAKDPQNLLLARGARFRMEAEMIHDVALDASGLLSEKVGGPSVFPYQPDHMWDSPYSGQQWITSKNENRFRRGIYTFWKRTAPYPSFVALDATSRESCTVRRIRTNTPLQALALLNDKLMLEASAHLGKRMEASGHDLASQLSAGFELCTSRLPNPAELDRLEKLENLLESRYSAKPKEALALGAGPRDAALTMVGNVLLNLDETITKS